MMAITATSARPEIEFGGTTGVNVFGIGAHADGRRRVHASTGSSAS